MDKINIYAGGSQRRINPDWFTAKTRMRDIGEALKITEHKMYHVYFEKGSRTKLHWHNGGQVLIVTEGPGSLELFKRHGGKNDSFGIKRTQKISLKKGDTAYIPARQLHTHGSTSTRKTFAHIAVNIPPRKNAEYKTTWYESDFKGRATGIIK